MRTEAASNPTCDHFGFSCRQGILPDLSNSDCLPGRAGGTPVGLDGPAVVETLREEGTKTPALVLSGVIADRSPYDGASGFRNRSEFCGRARMSARRHHAPPGQKLCPRPRRRAR